ncbi:MAG: glycosyltransferase family 4 protein [Pseudonocardiales bacterium]
MTAVHVVLPDGIDDPARVSGGNVYDRRVCRGLAATGWSVHEHAVAGNWPHPDAAARGTVARVLAILPDGAIALLDGLIAATVPEVFLAQAARLRLVVLAHMTFDDANEGAVMSGAAAVIATSDWTRRRLLDQYALRPDAVHVAAPGVDPAEIAPGTDGGAELLCVAAVTPLKGHDVLLDALAMTGEPAMRCVCVGTLTRDPEFVAALRRRIRDAGLDANVRLVGPLSGARLAAAYATADVLVLASRTEAYGMVVTEALARGLPVIATEVGGLPETLGFGADGARPGILVRPGDPAALAAAIRTWLGDAGLRHTLRRAALDRRGTLAGWSDTAQRIARVLEAVATSG